MPPEVVVLSKSKLVVWPAATVTVSECVMVTAPKSAVAVATLVSDPASRSDCVTRWVTVAVADMMIMADEVHAFEEENDMVRRVAAGPGAATPYDWEGMNIALIVRIHDHGLPATQAELVAEMQDWFADRSDGKQMPDSRSIRRRITPIWRALRREEA